MTPRPLPGPDLLPPDAPVAMPAQRLDGIDASSVHVPARPYDARRGPRLVVFGGGALLAGWATVDMARALAVGHFTALSALVLALFAVNVTWISVPFVTALAGFVRALARRPVAASTRPLATRTAVLLPTYNEDPARIAAALEAMARGVAAEGEGRAFDLFLLSDTTDGDVALAEVEAVLALRLRLHGVARIYYRRRRRNTAQKPGNIHDFCVRWGGAYDHLLMLDADSLMDGRTLVELARRMEADPDAGLIQTLPRLHRGRTPLARLQAFAGSLYGELLGRGLAWWTGSEAAFWGHNAIVRTRAFVQGAGLPTLSGRRPFGGSVLSHDFVEAALLRRAGWRVVIADDLGGSYEECPPSLLDLAVRDRRWCQGNLQHAKLLRAAGLHPVSRVHFLNGILSYLSAPLWLGFVLATLALAVQYEIARQRYFPASATLFPLWPRIDPARAVRLFGLTTAVLFGPKILGLLAALLDGARRRAHGGALRLLAGFVVEVVLSALVAPVMGLVHCAVVADVLRGRDSGWGAQQREGDGVPWALAWRRHRGHVLAGLALAAIAGSISPQLLAWLSPAVVGLLLAPALERFTASSAAGDRLARAGVFRTPEETERPAVAAVADAALPDYRQALVAAPGFAAAVRDPARLVHLDALARREPPPPAGEVDALEAVAEKKVREAPTLEEAVNALGGKERARLLSSPLLLRMLTGLTPAAQRVGA